MSATSTFTMRIDPALKKQLYGLADQMGMSATMLAQLVLRGFVAHPKLELDLTETGWVDTTFDQPVSAKEFISWLESELAWNSD